jgi:hypothetical protein
LTAAVLLAHQGGWDEALFVVGPLIFIVMLLRTAKRRADRNLQQTEPIEPVQPERTDQPARTDQSTD